MTIELKRLPGLDGEPKMARIGGGIAWVDCFESRGKARNWRFTSPLSASAEEAAADWNAMIDRIIEECRK